MSTATAQRDRPTYRVRDWDRHFVTADARKLKGPWRWVPLPTRHDSKGYRRLIRRPNGLAMYGTWCVLLAVSAKCSPPGTLQDSDGPLTPDDIADKTGAPTDLISETMAVLSDPNEGIWWLEIVPSTVSDVNASGDPRLTTGNFRLQDKQNRTGQAEQNKQDKQNTDSANLQSASKKKSGSVFSWLNVEDLHDVGKLIEWHKRASKAKPPVIGPTDADRLNVVSAAVHCWDKADDPIKLFAWIVGKGQWHTLNELDEDTAHQLIKEHLQGGSRKPSRQRGDCKSAADAMPDLLAGLGATP